MKNRFSRQKRFVLVSLLGILCLGALLVRGNPPIIRAQSPPASSTSSPPATARGPRCQELSAQLNRPKAHRSPAFRRRLEECQKWAQRQPVSRDDPFTRVSPNVPSDKARLSAGQPARSGNQRAVIIQFDQPPVARFRLEQLAPEGKPLQLLSPAQQESVRQYADQLTRAQDQVIGLLRQRGIDLKVKQRYRYTFNGMAIEVPAADVGQLRQIPGVKAVFPDRPVWATLSDSVPLIGAPTIWAMQDGQGRPVQGQDVVVAIIDTGIDYTHPDLGGCTAVGPGCRVADGHDFVNDDNDPFDDAGHGTHVAGIVGANGTVKGVAP